MIGDKLKAKHEKILQDSRASITFYRTGTAAGEQGPTVFLVSATQNAQTRSGYNDDWLVRHGAAPGSTILRTPTAFMTEDAWVAMTPKVSRGIRQLPVIRDSPDWWCLKIVDGFGAHCKNLDAMQMYHMHKILVLKEEGDASHVNQAYDDVVARTDKAWIRDGVDILRRSTSLTRGVVDQWQLIHVGLHAVRACTRDAWIMSFKRVNIHPKFRVPFGEWCKKIEHFIQAGQTFYQPADTRDIFALLPAFWRGMRPCERQLVVSIIDDHHHGQFTVACVRELHSVCHVLLKDMQLLRVCYEVAKQHPDHLVVDRPCRSGISTCWWYPWWLQGYDVRDAATDTPVRHHCVQVVPVTHGLHSFMLKPPGLHGTELFEHMIRRAARDKRKGESHIPRAWYDVHMTRFQRDMLNPTPEDLALGEIMRAAGGDGATKKEAQRRLDSWGCVQAHSQFANDPSRLAKMKRQLQMAASLAEITRITQNEKAAAATSKEQQLLHAAPGAAQKLKSLNASDLGRLTKLEICAVARVHYGAQLCSSAPKGGLVRQLADLISAKPHALDNIQAAPPRERQRNTSASTSFCFVFYSCVLVEICLNA